MATYECGECGAEFNDAPALQAHREAAHDARPRPAEPKQPRSAQQKPIPDEAPAPEAPSIRRERPKEAPEGAGEGEGARD